MSFRSMKLIIPILIYMILGFGSASAASFYTWSGNLEVGQSVYLNDLTLTVDQDNVTGELALIVESSGRVLGLLRPNQSGKFDEISISFQEWKGYGVISAQSEKPFSISFTTARQYQREMTQLEQENARLKSENEKLSKQVQGLQSENKQLKQQVSDLQSKLKNQPNTAKLNAKLVNLTKQNRALKAELANLTRQYNALKAKADFLSQQNEEYRQIIQQVMNEQSSEAKQSYIEKAKKEKIIGSVLLKSIIFAGVVVGLVGYGLYRKKRGWELGGL